MKKFLAATSAALLALTFVAATAFAANPATGKSSITAFGPDATQTSKTTVTIDTDPFTGGGGAYIPGFNKSFYGVRTALVKDLSNTFTGPLGIDPRWSIPIDNTEFNLDAAGDGSPVDGDTDYFLFASFADCNIGGTTVNVITDPTCLLYDSRGGAPYANWAAFVQTDVNTNIAVNDFYAFVIADGSGAAGVWAISNMKVGKPGK